MKDCRAIRLFNAKMQLCSTGKWGEPNAELLWNFVDFPLTALITTHRMHESFQRSKLVSFIEFYHLSTILDKKKLQPCFQFKIVKKSRNFGFQMDQLIQKRYPNGSHSSKKSESFKGVTNILNQNGCALTCITLIAYRSHLFISIVGHLTGDFGIRTVIGCIQVHNTSMHFFSSKNYVDCTFVLFINEWSKIKPR